MIPGPVAGRAPIDPGVAQRPLTETPGEAADPGASFADLLAAMLAPGGPGVQLQGPAGPVEAVFERLDAAEVFNETGLFRGAAPLPSAGKDGLAAIAEAAAAAAGRAAAPASDPQAELKAALSPPAGEAAPLGGAATGPAGRIAAGLSGVIQSAATISKAALPASLPLRGQSVSAPGLSSPGTEAEGETAASPGRVPQRTAAMIAQLIAAKGGSAAAQVSVQAVEGGINVAARADKLSREERDRLREEIGALLASYGFGGAQIWLNGEAWPLPKGENS
jgi:hypothetical protein